MIAKSRGIPPIIATHRNWIIKAFLLAAFQLVVLVFCNKSMGADWVGWNRLSGIWTVISVKVDTSGVSAWVDDDPELMGKRFYIEQENMRYQSYGCYKPEIVPKARNIKLGELIQGIYDPDNPNKIKAMGIKQDPATLVDTYELVCRSGSINATLKQVLFFWLDPDTLAMTWVAGGLLILNLVR
jgi:hypothetical protein